MKTKDITITERLLLEAIEDGRPLVKIHQHLKGSNPNTRKRVVLIWRVLVGDLKVTEQRDTAACESALCLAVMRGRSDVVSALLEAGANPNEPLSWQIPVWSSNWDHVAWEERRWYIFYSYQNALALALLRGSVQFWDGTACSWQQQANRGRFKVGKMGAVTEFVNPATEKSVTDDLEMQPAFDVVAALVKGGARVVEADVERARAMTDKRFVELLEKHVVRNEEEELPPVGNKSQRRRPTPLRMDKSPNPGSMLDSLFNAMSLNGTPSRRTVPSPPSILRGRTVATPASVISSLADMNRDPSPPPYAALHVDRHVPRRSTLPSSNLGGSMEPGQFSHNSSELSDDVDGTIGQAADILGWPHSRVQALARSLNPEEVSVEALIEEAFANLAFSGHEVHPPIPSSAGNFPTPQSVNTPPALPPREVIESSRRPHDTAHASATPELPLRLPPQQTTTSSGDDHANGLVPPPRLPTHARSSSLSTPVAGGHSESVFSALARPAVMVEAAQNLGGRPDGHEKGAKTASGPHQLTPDICVVCMDNPKDTVLVPCGHLAMCYDCAEHLRTTVGVCAVCRQEIMMVVRTYRV
ncbi:hypothetical protein M427DRAFT_151085 [Gonapodya prolifera JEL478]|uniref:RING-type domain-containing protein n=1 Tax=Gonapodya prolifera (strain JEL478) TaxID=1344416 RepID=A0A139AZ30_GONPJ|nr:hypothetical protein M427DRAFT_151085 [Gonapodya prolifera JEL478]|eukprot:KXS21813.1 hypothetical protein M427DRAFT_151085 [Gonapodya prolifera JEL478]